MRSRLVARGIITAALLVVALLPLACGGSDAPGSAPSNLTDEQMARLEDFADSVEADGDLRPALPAYVPPGLDPSPEITDKSKQHIVFAFLPAKDESSEKTAVPLFLEIGQQFDPLDLPLLCGDEASSEDFLRSDPDLECVKVGGRPADLETTEQPDDIVDYDIGFELDELDIHMHLPWKRGPDATRETEEQMKEELLRVAESMTAP